MWEYVQVDCEIGLGLLVGRLGGGQDQIEAVHAAALPYLGTPTPFRLEGTIQACWHWLLGWTKTLWLLA